ALGGERAVARCERRKAQIRRPEVLACRPRGEAPIEEALHLGRLHVAAEGDQRALAAPLARVEARQIAAPDRAHARGFAVLGASEPVLSVDQGAEELSAAHARVLEVDAQPIDVALLLALDL